MESFAAESRRFRYTLASKMVNFGLIMAPIAAFEAIRRPGRPVNNKNIRKSQSEPLEIQLMLKESLEDKITFLRNWGHSEVAPEKKWTNLPVCTELSLGTSCGVADGWLEGVGSEKHIEISIRFQDICERVRFQKPKSSPKMLKMSVFRETNEFSVALTLSWA